MGIYDDIKSAVAIAHRVSAGERGLAEHVRESRAALTDLRGVMQELRDRQLRIEVRLEALDDIITTKAQAAAAAAATAGVAGALAGLSERLAVLEERASPKPPGTRRRLTGKAGRQDP